MYLAFMLHQPSRLTFGHETAQFESLVAFMAIVSIATWSIVLATILIRICWSIWLRRHSETPGNENVLSD